ncbi:putative phosphatidate phosphatase [Trichonephila inaurata madagascariensis]|uniref:Putative phosphatidate phosphatase n=1 Tax=Trichonephila inaurata madagascariensis TaxID=2747483 RepID=A0A8X6IA49_9ARAC|nr:putative phosphatidate phosphatase [Trichonephila inaurata madagascariensis]
MVQSNYKINQFPFRILSFLFLIYSNSSFATIGKKAGFFCDDESIKKPYHGDSVHVTYLFIVLLGIFPLFIHVSEYLFRKEIAKCSPHSTKSQSKLLLNYYYSGFLHVLAVTEVLKVFVSELRPHFYYTCLPDMSNINCSKGFITNFNCTGNGSRWLIDRDIYKSFPSGHSALSFYCFIFITTYLYSRRKDAFYNCLNVWWARIVPPICFLWAIICCVSRILDNRHFWWDVLSGVCIGIVAGFVTIHFTLSKAAHKKSAAD